jgi:hypothetical protein
MTDSLTGERIATINASARSSPARLQARPFENIDLWEFGR